MELAEDTTENAVSKIKERKMGRLFEGVTFNFQTAIKEAAEKAAEAEKELKITRYIAKLIMNKYSDIEIKESLIREFSLSEEQAEEEYRKMADYIFAK